MLKSLAAMSGQRSSWFLPFLSSARVRREIITGTRAVTVHVACNYGFNKPRHHAEANAVPPLCSFTTRSMRVNFFLVHAYHDITRCMLSIHFRFQSSGINWYFVYFRQMQIVFAREQLLRHHWEKLPFRILFSVFNRKIGHQSLDLGTLGA